MDAYDLAQWKRFAAKGGIGSCTAVVDCAAETPGDLMFFQDDEITVLMPIEGKEGRYMGYCEGVVGQFSATDVRFHGPLKKAVAVRRLTRASSTGTSSLGHSSPKLPAQDIPIPSSGAPSQATSRTASPSETPKTMSPRHSVGPPASSASGDHHQSILRPPNSNSPTLLAPMHDGVEASASTRRSSLASATETSLPQTPGDITETEQEIGDPGVRVERNSVSPDHPQRASAMKPAGGGDVVNAFLEKVRQRDTISSFGDSPLSLRNSVGTVSSRADSPPLIPPVLRGSMAEEEHEEEQENRGSIRDSIASSLTNSPPPRFSKPPPLNQSESAADDASIQQREADIRDSVASSYIEESGIRDSIASSHYDDEEGIRASIASSDGGFGIGMQFIQGLIGNPAARSTESGESGYSDDSEVVPNGRVTSMMTDESFHLPDWGAPSHLPPQPEEEELEDVADPDGDNESVSSFGNDPSPAPLRQEPSTVVSRDERDEATPEALTPVLVNDSTPTETPAEAHITQFLPVDEPEVADHLPSQTDRLSTVEPASPVPGPSDELDYDANRAPSTPGAQSPAMSVFPGSGSEAGGSYYEEDLDIYDNYRYSRFSMMSRKSRKSQMNMSFPDPSSMPALDSFPLPPPLNTSRTIPSRNNSSDRLVSSPRSTSSFSPNRMDFHSSPKRFDFPPPVQPLSLRKQSTMDPDGASSIKSPTSITSPTPLSPTRPGSRSAKLATSLRQQIEEEERRMQEGEDDETSSQTSAEEDTVEAPEQLTTAFRIRSDAFSEDGSDVHPAEEGNGSVVDRESSSSHKSLVTSPPLSSLPSESTDLDASSSSHTTIDAGRMSKVPEEPGSPEENNSGTAQRAVSAMDLALAKLEGRRSPSVTTHSEALSPTDTALALLEGRKSTGPSPSPEPLSVPESAAIASQFSIENPSGKYLSPSGRPLTFLPHPNAPKPLQAPSQPAIYAQTTLQPQAQTRPPPSPEPTTPGRPPLMAIMHMAYSHYRNPPPPVGNSPSPPATIHGRCKTNLQNATGPVKIDWFLENGNGPPPPEEAPRPPAIAIPGAGSRLPGSPLRSATLDVPPSPGSPLVPNPDSGRTSPAPRHNFFPRARPRSRSFTSMTGSFIQPDGPNGKHDSRQGFRAPSILSAHSSERSSVSSSTSKSPLGPSRSMTASLSSSNLAKPERTPPPIIIPRTLTGSASTSNLRSPPPSSPLANPPLTSSLGPPTPNGSNATLSPNLSARLTLRNSASTSALRSEVPLQEPRAPPNASSSSPQPIPPPSPVPSTAASEAQQDKDTITSPVSIQTSVANDTDSVISGNHSLRSKLSGIGLRSKSGPGSSNPGTPTNAQAHFELSDERVQVKDGGAAMEFEIVKPTIPRIAEVKVADGDGDRSDQASLLSSGTRNEGESNFLHSPAVSPGRLPTVDLPTIREPDISQAPANPESIQAHREREQKWLSLMNSTSSANAKKNKKVRKLVQEGIPNSVRSVVWLFLTNTKSRRMDGLYTQLCSRGKVPASSDIERDAERSFPSHPHLQDPKGPIVVLLQAYLRMVPDIVYQQGLAAMAGTILLQAPEEDSFWTFLALMDNHLRGYFAVNSNQMTVDAQLLQKALDAADPALAKAVYTDLRLDPVEVARPWFSALFVNSLPHRYLYRVWDMFIYDGAPWLFRVALTLLIASKSFILSEPKKSSSDVLDYLFRPPLQVLPQDPDTFVAACLAVKLKEDELRKLRPKLEAALKPQSASTSRLLQIKGLRSIKPVHP